MGRAKEGMIRDQEHQHLAAAYLVSQGVLKQCPVHHEIYGGFMDLEDDFWRNAMADRNRGKNGPVPWAAELEAREYTDYLKSAYEDHFGDECGFCAKIMARD